jgi:hypothetical protein
MDIRNFMNPPSKVRAAPSGPVAVPPTEPHAAPSDVRRPASMAVDHVCAALPDMLIPVTMTPDDVRVARADWAQYVRWIAYCDEHVLPMLFSDPELFCANDKNELGTTVDFMNPPSVDDAFCEWLQKRLSAKCTDWRVRVLKRGSSGGPHIRIMIDEIVQ